MPKPIALRIAFYLILAALATNGFFAVWSTFHERYLLGLISGLLFFYNVYQMFKWNYLNKREKKFTYSYHSYTIPEYNIDMNTPNFALMMPTKAHKPIRKWYQIFKKKPYKPSFQITDNPDGTKTWELK